MIVFCAGMNKINNELRRTQNELTLPEFEHFALFAVHDLFHRKERKDCLIGLYAINHRVHREHRVAFLCVLCALCGFSKQKKIISPWRGRL